MWINLSCGLKTKPISEKTPANTPFSMYLKAGDPAPSDGYWFDKPTTALLLQEAGRD